ncbi:flagellar assembly protein FliH [Microaerobacter geothermalis]|uniref:flagellar assembly protein FliH n=1 Tax=Microaerobacter geothermalis TaxID=674972 RepID=UPI001F2EB878|nr:flagellar assembly protein FliH [Microaerobacter geothermalis]MCF6093838.1 flagellar assembly protein FliH [Microaerobacter geothermalis]
MSRIIKASQYSAESDIRVIHSTIQPSKGTTQEKKNEGTSEANQLISDAEEAASKIINQAKEEIARLKEEANREISSWWNKKKEEARIFMEDAKKTGYQEGYQLGKKEAYQIVEKEEAERYQSAQKIVELAYAEKNKIIEEAEPVLLELSLSIARKIISSELKTHPDQILSMVKEALQRAREQEKITIYVHPEHYSFIQESKGELLSCLNGHAELHIIPDPSIKVGGCSIKTSLGTIDGRVDTQLEEIREILVQAAQGRG